MSKRQLLGASIAALLLAVAIFFGATLWLGSWQVAPVRSEGQALPRDLSVEAVSLESADGTRLSGWYVDSQRACGTILLMHPVRGGKVGMVPRARFLAEAGYAVFLFDFRAHGESGGKTITFGDLEREDAAAAMRFVAERRPGQAVGIIGFSLGGVSAVLNGRALGADALVLEAVYTSFDKALSNRVRLHGGNLGPLSDFLAKVLLIQFEWRFGIHVSRLRPIEHVATLGVPLFIIAGSDDRHTTPEDSLQLFDQAAEPKRFWLVEGAGHVDYHRQNPRDYREKVLDFLQEHMPCR